MPLRILNQKINYVNIKDFVENNSKLLLKSIKEYSF